MLSRQIADRLMRWRPDDRRACLVAYGLLAIWCLPLYGSFDSRGSIALDWEWFLAYFEALRQSLVDHGQFPGFNPWMYLGSPLWANPQIGPVSHFTPLVLVFGPLYGMKLGIVVNYLVSFETARALGRRLFHAPLAAVIAALLFALNAGLASHWVLGQACFSGWIWAPLLVLACLQLAERRWAGLAAGAVAGLMVHYGVHYAVIYALLFAALLAVAVALRGRAWRALLRFGALFALSMVAVCAARLVPLMLVLADFPREIAPRFSLDGEVLWRMLLLPELGPTTVWLRIKQPGMLFQLTSSEFYAYVGVATLGLAVLSLRWGLRFYHVGALLAFGLMLGNSAAWQPSRWLSALPPFSSMWVVTRWRIVLLACLALAAGRAIDRLLTRAPPGDTHRPTGEGDGDERGAGQEVVAVARASLGRVRLLALAVWLAPLELVGVLFTSWSTHVSPHRDQQLTRRDLGLPRTSSMVAMRDLRPPNSQLRVYFALFRANVGAAAGYDPLFGYLPARSLRRYVGHPAYRGEFTADGAPVTPQIWSPNRLRFEGLPAGSKLELNLNPGRGWSLDGKPHFASMRLFELRRRFVVAVPASGVVDLRYRPPGLLVGLASSFVAALLLLGWWWLARARSGRGQSQSSGSSTSASTAIGASGSEK